MSILGEILEHKRAEIAALDPLRQRAAAESAPAPRDFVAAVAARQGAGGRQAGRRPRLIAELKRASPSKGIMAPRLDLLKLADVYARNGAAAVSVLTDKRFFMGSLETLQDLRYKRGIPLPLLRKDFIISEAQVHQTRACGGDALLLIVAALPDDVQLAELHHLALELGLAPLVEVHNPEEVERALRLTGLKLIGINNRDLETFSVSLETTERLRPMVPPEITVIAESGISDRSGIDRMAQAGVDAVLVGEALVTSDDIARTVRELAGQEVISEMARPRMNAEP